MPGSGSAGKHQPGHPGLQACHSYWWKQPAPSPPPPPATYTSYICTDTSCVIYTPRAGHGRWECALSPLDVSPPHRSPGLRETPRAALSPGAAGWVPPPRGPPGDTSGSHKCCQLAQAGTGSEVEPWHCREPRGMPRPPEPPGRG